MTISRPDFMTPHCGRLGLRLIANVRLIYANTTGKSHRTIRNIQYLNC